MRLFFIILTFLCCCSNPVRAQYIEPELVKKAMLSWQKNAQDSIKTRRAEAQKIRPIMKGIVKDLNYDEFLIFGPDNKWIAEDMNLMFARAPVPFGVAMQRAPKQIELEKNHVKLYWSDLSLYRWKKIGGIMDSLLKTNEVPPSWTDYKYDDEKVAKIRSKDALKIANERIAKSLYGQLSNFFPNGNELLKAKKVEQKQQGFTLEEETKASDNQYVTSCYPFQGQFNYYEDESVNKEGYVIFNRMFIDSVYRKLDDFPTYKIEWSDRKKFVFSQDIRPKTEWPTVKFEFKIPANLQKQSIYRTLITASDGTTSKLVWVNYFRVSKYGSVEKIKKIGEKASEYNRNTGSIKLSIDEPFDYYETTAKNQRQRICYITSGRENMQTIDYVLKSSEITAYLTVPSVTPVDTSDLNNIPIAEKDHTANAPFVRKINLLHLENFIAYSFENLNSYRKDTFRIGKLVIIPELYKEKDTIVGAFIAPFVRAADFKNGKISLPKKFDYEIMANNVKLQSDIWKQLKAAVEERMTERATFFYLLTVRAWKRGEIPQKPNYQQFVKEEKQNLTKHLAFLIDGFSFHQNKTIKINVQKSDFNERTMTIWDIEAKAK